MPFLEQASSFSRNVDTLFLWFFAVSVAALLLITFTIVTFVIRYRRSRNPEPVDIEGNVGLEVAWTVIPLVIFLVMFYFGWTNYDVTRNPPPDAMTVEVIGRQWAWSFKYPNGRQAKELTVALGRPVALVMSSADVIHGFYIPAFRLKMDVVPGTTTRLWFVPLLLGSFDIQCTVICGVNHTYMLSKVNVLPEEAFRAWYFTPDGALDPGTAEVAVAAPAPPPAATAEAELGGLAILKRNDCLECHSVDGTTGVGPTFKGLMGSVQEFAVGGADRSLTVDEPLVVQGIRTPDRAQMKGYPPVMPAFDPSAEELAAMVAALRSLGVPPAPPVGK